ncbi:MAG: hypothetical protein ABIH23_32830 [bacterium]
MKSDDKQAQYCAAMLLAYGLKGSVQADVSDALLINLKHDRRMWNAVSAYNALLALGRDNLLDVLQRTEPEDWQQAAMLQFAALKLGIEWLPPQRILALWSEIAEGSEGDWMNPWTPEIPKMLAIGALYLCPARDEFFKDREPPQMLKKMLNLSPRLKNLDERIAWTSTWFWLTFLQRDFPYLAAPLYWTQWE